jgi:hypothetical protein
MSGQCSAVLRLHGEEWVLSGDPYLLHRSVSAVPFARRAGEDSVTFPVTEETAVELH